MPDRIELWLIMRYYPNGSMFEYVETNVRVSDYVFLFPFSCNL